MTKRGEAPVYRVALRLPKDNPALAEMIEEYDGIRNNQSKAEFLRHCLSAGYALLRAGQAQGAGQIPAVRAALGGQSIGVPSFDLTPTRGDAPAGSSSGPDDSDQHDSGDSEVDHDVTRRQSLIGKLSGRS